MKSYYKICLLSPLWFPALLALIYGIAESVHGSFIDMFPDWIAVLGFIVVFSVLFGGLQYILTLLIIWRKIDFESYESWVKWILLLPLIFTPIQVLGVWLFSWMSDGQFVGLSASVGLMVFDLGVAYSYVAVWLVSSVIINTMQNGRSQEAVYE